MLLEKTHKNVGSGSEMRYEQSIRKIYGQQWQQLPEYEKTGCWGIAIVKSVLDGVYNDLRSLSRHLNVDENVLLEAHKNLTLNGIFQRDRVFDDWRSLQEDDIVALGYYAGYASGATGPFNVGRDNNEVRC